MRIVITGALGHIGSLLIRELPQAIPGVELLLIDNFHAERYCSLFDLPHGKFKFIEADVLTADLLALIDGVDSVIHLAAITNAAGSFEMAGKVEAVNYDGTIRIAEACKKLDVPLIFLSTTSVYGSQSETVDEDCPNSDLQPQSPYAEAKFKSEELLRKMYAKDELKLVILRFGTIFGVSPGMRFHTAVNKFIFQASTGQAVTVWRTALNQKRPYLDVRDAVDGLIFVLKNKVYDGEVYNVLTCNCTVNDILDTIRIHYPDLEINYVDTKIMNQLSYEVLNYKFRECGFEFSGNLQAGVDDTVRKLQGINSFHRVF